MGKANLTYYIFEGLLFGRIVPLFSAQFERLMNGLEKDDGGTLWVAEGIGGVMFA